MERSSAADLQQNVDELRQRIIEEWERLDQRVIDNAVKQWRQLSSLLCGCEGRTSPTFVMMCQSDSRCTTTLHVSFLSNMIQMVRFFKVSLHFAIDSNFEKNFENRLTLLSKLGWVYYRLHFTHPVKDDSVRISQPSLV